MLAAFLLPCFKERLGILFLWLISIASLSFYLSSMATSGERSIENKKRLESTSENVLFNYSVQFVEEKVGYVLASHYSDVYRGSAINLQSMQCWASSLPGQVKVVEPFLRHDSVLGVNLTSNYEELPEKTVSNSVLFTQVYDRVKWVGSTSQNRYAPLVSWSYFIKNAPRKLILVDKSCNNVTHICMQCSNGFYRSDVFQFSASEFTRQHGFSVVRRVCYGLTSYSYSDLQMLIYGPHKPEEVVVLFNHFGGLVSLKDNYRIQIHGRTGRKCRRQARFFPIFSKQVNKDVEKYMSTFLPDVGTGQYVSVVLYMEHFLKSKGLKNLSKEEQMRSMLSCISEVVQKVDELKKKLGMPSVVISSDTGKYGSTYISNFKKFHMKEVVFKRSLDLIQSRLVGGTNKFDDGSARLESISSSSNPAYIAMLEKHILTSGECLVLVGQSKFELELTQWFEHNHSDKWTLCIHRVCTNL